MIEFFQYLIDAVRLGALYALLALGIAIIFGIMKLINFAHGELIAAGGILLMFTGAMGVIPSLAAVILIAVLLSVAMERIAFRSVRGADPATLLVTSFAVSYFMQNAAIMIIGSRPRGLALPPLLSQSLQLGELRIPVLSILTIVLAVGLLTSLALFLKRTALGNQMRAAAEDFEMARLVGIRADNVVATAFVIGGVLAGVASLLYFSERGTASPTAGVDPALIGFVATVIGGMSTLSGAALGGFLLGCVTVALQALLPDVIAPYRQSFVYLFVILVLLTRPDGLLKGRSSRARVG